MKTEKRKTLQGSVLFTVVCVMALLIIFLTGTLALASASSNRAHKSYSSSQASYTARAAVESFVKAMEREPGIPAAIENLEDPLYASVLINDKTLGQIGCYKNGVWTKDVIEIAPVADTQDRYIFADPKGNNDWKWIKVTSVKVTAVCRVGKEEETVTALIRKSPGGSTKTTPGGIRGLQEVGGNAFPNGAHITGGLGVGIASSGDGMYTVHNNTQVETTLTFVHGSLTAGTGSSNFYVKKPVGDKVSTPYSQTVITGNLWLNNGNFMVVDYDMGKTEFTEKEIPYLYIDGTIGGANPGMQPVSGEGNGPFNIFIGTLDGREDKTLNGVVPHEYNFGHSDLYLMDKNIDADGDGELDTITLKYPGTNGQDEARNFSSDALMEGNDPRTDAEKACDKEIVKGNNYLGTSNGTNKLYSWAKSCINKTQQFKSNGGNIFCNGNLTIENFIIDGDLRVDGNCTIGKGVSVGGKIVVHGRLDVNDANFNQWNKIYCDDVHAVGDTNAVIPVLQEGYSEHLNELLPGYKEVHNFVYENDPIDEGMYEVREAFKSPDDGWRWHIRYPEDDENGRRISEENDGWGPQGAQLENYKIYVITDDNATVEGSRVGETVPRYRTGTDGFPTDTITFNSTVIYKADPIENDIIYMDDTNNCKIVDEEFSYYKKDDEGNAIPEQEVSRDDAYGDFYLYGEDPTPRSKSEAYKDQNVTTNGYIDFGEPAYPPSMTREAIYGSGDSIDDFKVEPETKIIKNLLEMRSDLKLDPYGNIDRSVYFTSVPESEWDNSVTEGVRDGVYKLPYAFIGGVKNSEVWNGDYIVKSCVIGNTDGSTFDIPAQVKIKSTNIVWVVLRNVNFNQNDGKMLKLYPDMDGKQIVCNTSEGGTVRFLIDGKLTISKGAIIKEGFKNNDEINPNTKWGIEFYGTEDVPSSIECGNNVTFCGTFMCPATTFSGNVAGAYNVYYTDEYGERTSLNCPIIGSALFKKVEKAKNAFGVINSGGGGISKETESVETVFGTYKISYFMGV